MCAVADADPCADHICAGTSCGGASIDELCCSVSSLSAAVAASASLHGTRPRAPLFAGDARTLGGGGGGVCCEFARGVCARGPRCQAGHVDVRLSELGRVGCSRGDACVFHARVAS